MLRRGVLLLGGILGFAERFRRTASLDGITRLDGRLGRTALVQGKKATRLRRAVLLLDRVTKYRGMLIIMLLEYERAIFSARLWRVALLVSEFPMTLSIVPLWDERPIFSAMLRAAALLVTESPGL